MGELGRLIEDIKSGDTDKVLFIIEKMKPLINKYKRILYKDDKEDVEAELLLALWQAICKIQYFDDDAQCVVFLKNALNNKFLELYRNSCKIFDNEEQDVNDLIEVVSCKDKYNDVIFKHDILNIIKRYDNKKYELAYAMLINEMTDIEIATKID